MSDLPLLFNPEPTVKLGSTIILQLITTFLTSIYLLSSMVGLFIGGFNYQSVCKQHFQLLIILESVISLPLSLYGLNVIYNKSISYVGIGFWITGFVISSTFIMTGMFIIWNNDVHNTDCPDMVYIFSYIYFNLWWILAGIGIIFMSIVSPVYKSYKLKIDI